MTSPISDNSKIIDPNVLSNVTASNSSSSVTDKNSTSATGTSSTEDPSKKVTDAHNAQYMKGINITTTTTLEDMIITQQLAQQQQSLEQSGNQGELQKARRNLTNLPNRI